MKKTMMLAAFAGLFLVSCKKDYTCECTITSTTYVNGTATVGTPQVTDTDLGKMKKADAEDKCEKDNGDVMTGDTQNGIKANKNCDLK
jgi:hypothetical protein